MPLHRDTQLPPPPEPGEKTFWDYFPRRTWRRVLFLLIALGIVIYLKSSGGGSFGGLFDGGKSRPADQGAGPVYHLEVKPAPNAPQNKSKP